MVKISSPAKRLKELIGDRSLTDFAREMKISKQSISAYINGERNPKDEFMYALVEKYGVSLDWLHGFNVAKMDGKLAAISAKLNDAGMEELVDYGEYLSTKDEFLLKTGEQRNFYPIGAPDAVPNQDNIVYIRKYLVPSAAGFASPIEGEDYELVPVTNSVPAKADFCITISGDSMAPYINDGDTVYVQRDASLDMFDVGIFFVDGDVLCKQFCVDPFGTLYLLSANRKRKDADREIRRDSESTVVCFGKVILPKKLPRPL